MKFVQGDSDKLFKVDCLIRFLDCRKARMQPSIQSSIQFAFVGVGALIAFSNTAASFAETVPRQSQNPIATQQNSPAPIVQVQIAGQTPIDSPKQSAAAVNPQETLAWKQGNPSAATTLEATSTAPSSQPSWIAKAARLTVPTIEAIALPEQLAIISPSVPSQPVQSIAQAVAPQRTGSSPGDIQTPPLRSRLNPLESLNRPGDRPLPPPGTDVTIDLNIGRPLGLAKPGPAPEYLDPDPNPLQFPTQPSEVDLRGIQPISLQQAIELAERNNRTLQVSIQQLDRSRAALREAQAARFPSLDLQTNLSNSRSSSGELSQLERQRSQTTNFFNDGGDESSTSFNGNITLSYDVFTFGLRPAQIRASERQVRSDELAVEVTREQLRLDVANDYYNLQESDTSVRINEVAVTNDRLTLRDAIALETAGLGTRFDVLRAEVDLANSRQQLTNAISQQRIRRRQLAQRLSVPMTVDLASADPVQIAGTWNLTVQDSVVLAFKNRAELEQQLAQRELSQQQRLAALAGQAPQISVSAQYNFLDSFNDQFGIADGYSFSAGLRWNLYDGGAARARADQQALNIAIAETRFADARNQIRFQVEQAYSSLLANLENVGTTDRALIQAAESVNLARLRFRAGVGTQLDVSEAITDLTRAQGNRINAVLGYNRALAELQRSISNLPPGTATLTPSPSSSSSSSLQPSPSNPPSSR